MSKSEHLAIGAALFGVKGEEKLSIHYNGTYRYGTEHAGGTMEKISRIFKDCSNGNEQRGALRG